MGALATRNRRYLTGPWPWPWSGALLALVIWLPNLLWQVQNRGISLYFLASIHTRDVQAGLTSGFLIDQIKFNLNPVMLFLVTAGLYYFFFARAGQRYRMMGWMYVVPFILLILAKGKGYYLAATYPMLAAGGAVWWEGRLTRMTNQRWARAWRRAIWSVLIVFVVLFAATELPVAPLGSAWWNVISNSNVELKAEIGWPELVQQVAKVYDSLSRTRRPQITGPSTCVTICARLPLPGPISGSISNISGR